jgi:hypothetical protein
LTAWVTTSALFVLVILEIGSTFLPRLAWTKILLFYAASCCSGDTEMLHHNQLFSTEMGVSQFLVFCLGYPGSGIILISSSCIIRCESYMSLAQLLVGMGSHKLFAWAGLKPWSSWFQSHKSLGLQRRVTSYKPNPFF